MFGKACGLRSIGTVVAGLMWGAVPLAAQAIDAPQSDVVFSTTTVAAAGCGPSSGTEPVNIAVEPRADTVKDAPFSGVGTTEVVNTLADGNRIVRTNTMRYYRDSRGRTRTEYSLAAIGPFTPDQAQTIVMISDPVEGKRYMLHSAAKRAEVFKVPDPSMAKAGGAPAPGAANGIRVFSTSPGPEGPPPPIAGGGPTIVTRVAPPALLPPRGAGGAAAPPVVVMSGARPGLPPAKAGFFMQYAPLMIQEGGCKGNAKPLPAPTSLGERIIEGLKVTGTRMEFNIPAGAVGNEQPILVSSEQWFSPELGVVVSSTHRDPMMGDTTYKLEQITRAEPDPALFTVPADYTQTDISMNGPVFFEKGVSVSKPAESK